MKKDLEVDSLILIKSLFIYTLSLCRMSSYFSYVPPILTVE